MLTFKNIEITVTLKTSLSRDSKNAAENEVPKKSITRQFLCEFISFQWLCFYNKGIKLQMILLLVTLVVQSPFEVVIKG